MTEQDTRTVEQLILEAWSAQDACNASGLVFGFAKAMKRLCDLMPNGGRNDHIVTKLWVAKLADLCAVDSLDWSKAARLVDHINNGGSYERHWLQDPAPAHSEAPLINGKYGL